MNAEERTYYVVNVPDVPLPVSLIAGDVLQNLRSSLDHLACHLVKRAGGRVTLQTCFPIANGPDEYMSPRFRRKVEGMRQEAIDAIDVIEPYKGGKGAILWRLHRLNNIDKHRLLLTACSTHVGHSSTQSERLAMQKTFMDSHPGQRAPSLRGHLVSVPLGVPLKAGDKLHTVPHSELEENMQFLIDVAFDEPDVIECRPIVPALYDMSEAVLNMTISFDKMGLL